MSQETTLKLLKYPHAAVFDKSPMPELALRLRNPAGLRWTVAEDALSLEVGDNLEYDGVVDWNGSYDFGLTKRRYTLQGKTIAQLVDELAADGHEIAFENPAVGGLSALTLLAGSNDQGASNGDHLYVYTSLLWAILDSYAVELDEAKHQVGQALRQMVMTQAEGEWLDVWMQLYGVPRLPGETDPEGQDRLPKEVFRVRVNGIGIEQAIKDLTGQTVSIDEPWRRMHILDESPMSGGDHMQDGQFYTYHVIQPVGVEGTDWTGVIDIVKRNKAAGVDIAAQRVHIAPRHIDVQPPVEYLARRGTNEGRSSAIWGTRDQILDVMRLSDGELTINHPCNRHDWMQLTQEPEILYDGIHFYDGEATYGDLGDTKHLGFQLHQTILPFRNIPKAAIALSDGPAAGEENFIFSRGAESVSFDPEPIPSDEMFLSAYKADRVIERVELITTQENAAAIANPFNPAPEQFGHTDIRAFGGAEAYPSRTWTGNVYQFDGSISYDGSTAYDGTATYGGVDGSPTSTTTEPNTWDSRAWIGWRRVGSAMTSTPA